MKYCPYCGAGLDVDMRFCPKCGKPFEGSKENPHVTAKHLKAESPKYDPVSISAPPKKRGGIIALVIVSVLIALSASLYFSGIFAQKEEPQLPFSDDTAAITEVSNSVVMLNCYGKNGELYATGSAFAALGKNVFITNYHVISGDTFSIVAKAENGEEFSISTIIAYDIAADVAIVRSEGETGLTALPLGESALLKKGEKVTAIGSPLGLINTVSVGLYSGTVNDNGQTLLQFSAPVSHGSSGGALFNNHGEVVGITAASFENGQNLNFAIPIEIVTEMWNNHFDSTSMSLEKFFSTQEHSISILDLYKDINYYSSSKAPKKMSIDGYIFDINTQDREVTLVAETAISPQTDYQIIIKNVNSLIIDGLTIGEHVSVKGKIVMLNNTDAIVLDGKYALIVQADKS